MNRGSERSSGHRRTRPRGFNEAPIHESGKSTLVVGYLQCFCRFNEAPIHESGKFSFRAGRRSISVCFNEAPIHESGK